GGSVSVTSRQMVCLPNDFVRPSTTTSAPIAPPGVPSAPARAPWTGRTACARPRQVSQRAKRRRGYSSVSQCSIQVEKNRASRPYGLLARCRKAERLLDADLRAGCLELLLGGLGGLLVNLLEQRLRRALHEVLGLLETQARDDLTDDLDDLDLLVTG